MVCTRKYRRAKIWRSRELQIRRFHDDNRHVAVFGRGNDSAAGDYLQDGFSAGFAYDGGSSRSWERASDFAKKFDGDLELTAFIPSEGA